MKPNQAIIDGLQNLLADTYLLYIKAQGFHWNVTGPNFGPLHQLFQTQYEELALANDLIAERIRAVGGFAAGSCADFTKNSSLNEVSDIPDATNMIRGLYEDHALIADECRSFVEKLDDLDDKITEHLVSDRAMAHDKMAWMLKSHLD
jgi:starvation-inducible DNA-binding protein